MTSPKLFVHRTLKHFGLSVQRARDPFDDLAALLGAGNVDQIVDGGAYDGGLALKIAARFPRATIHSFEPNPETFAILSKRVASEQRVKTYQLALSDRIGEASFHKMEQSYNSSLLAPLSTEESTGLPLEQRLISREVCEDQVVQTTTLDTWAAEQKCRPVIVKLDLQGHEGAALRGASRILADSVGAVVTEVNFRPTYEGSTRLQDLLVIMESFGFQLYRFYDVISGPAGDWQLGDGVFVKQQQLALRV